MPAGLFSHLTTYLRPPPPPPPKKKKKKKKRDSESVFTARKIGFALFLIRIKDVVKYNNISDNTFDARQNYVKFGAPLHTPLTRIKSEFKCIDNFDPSFDARQIEIK